MAVCMNVKPVLSDREAFDVALDLKFLLMLLSGLMLWGIFGIFIESLPVVFFNFFGSLLWLPITFIKLKESLEEKGNTQE